MAHNNETRDIFNWKEEAEAVIDDVKFAVNRIFLSDTFPASDILAYLNIETKEKKKFCIEMSFRGFRVVAENFNTIDTKNFGNSTYYETPYSLLDAYSPQYKYLFGNELANKLSKLQS